MGLLISRLEALYITRESSATGATTATALMPVQALYDERVQDRPFGVAHGDGRKTAKPVPDVKAPVTRRTHGLTLTYFCNRLGRGSPP
jgi:hypothetical protein